MTFKRLQDVKAFIDANPNIDTVRFSAMPGLGGKAVYVALYGHRDDGYGGFGGATLTLEAFQQLRDQYDSKLRFDCTGSWPKIDKD